MSDKETLEFAQLLHEIYHQELSSQGKSANNNWGSLSQVVKDGWVKVAEYIFKNIEDIHQRERDINHNGHGGYNR